jgi:hypothetical protein
MLVHPTAFFIATFRAAKPAGASFDHSPLDDLAGGVDDPHISIP